MGIVDDDVARVREVTDLVALAGEHLALLRRLPATRITIGDFTRANEMQIWGEEPSSGTLMRDLKHRFDPSRTLQPGRFVGGI